MEFRVKPFGLMLLLSVTIAAVIFDFTEWSQVRVVTKQAEAKSMGSGHLLLLASSADNGWLPKQVQRFNEQNKGKIDIKIRFVNSPTALNDILARKEMPTMWAPGGSDWATHLGDLWAKRHQGQHIVDVGDASNFRIYLRTPLVLVSKKTAAVAGSGGASVSGLWHSGQAPVADGGTTEPCRIAFSDPSSSGTGRLTVAMILSNYALHNGDSGGDLDVVARSPGFVQYLRGLHDTPVHDSFTSTGGCAVLDAFIHNPKLYDVVAATESDALAAAAKDPTLMVTYPSPTCVQEQSVAVLSGAHWVSPEQRAAAQQFLTFLSGSGPISDGVKAHFRPAHPTSGLTLAGDLKTMSRQGFRQTFDLLDGLPYAAAEDAAHAWRVAAAGTEARSTARIVAYAR